MNNNYFYKLASVADRLSGMRKEGASPMDPLRGTDYTKPYPMNASRNAFNGNDPTRTPAPAQRTGTSPIQQATKPTTPPITTTQTAAAANSNSNSNANLATGEPTFGRGTPDYHPDSMTGRFLDGKPFGPAELKPGQKGYIPQNANDLANHWIVQKENFYRKRAEDPNDKFGSRYANYTVSREAAKGLEDEAKALWDEYNGKIPKEYLTREGAFNSAMDSYKQERIDRKKKQEQAAGAPMQNPTTTSAISNPPPGPTWTSENDRFNQAMAASNNSFWNYYDPRIQTPGFNRYNAYRAAALAPFYPSSYTASKVKQAFNDDLMASGLHFSNDPDVNTLWKAYQDAWSAHDYSDPFPATAPKDAALDKQNLAFWNAINLPTGDVRSPSQLVDHLLDSNPGLKNMPGGWDPNVWQALVNLYSRMKKV